MTKSITCLRPGRLILFLILLVSMLISGSIVFSPGSAEAAEMVDVVIDTVDQNGAHVDGLIGWGTEPYAPAPRTFSHTSGGEISFSASWNGRTIGRKVTIWKDRTLTVDSRTTTISAEYTPGTTKVIVVFEPIESEFDTVDQYGAHVDGLIGWGTEPYAPAPRTFSHANGGEISFSASWNGRTIGRKVIIWKDRTLTVDSRTTTISAEYTPGTTKVIVVFVSTAPASTPPSLTVPEDMTVPGDTIGGVASVLFTATASDAEDGSLTPVCTPVSGSFFVFGETMVICSVTDSGGLTATASFLVTVTNEPPILDLPSDLVVEAESQFYGRTPVYYSAAASDVEDGSLTPNCYPYSGFNFELGKHVVDCSVIDSAGTLATGSFTITVDDTTPPTLSNMPGDISVLASSVLGAAVTYTTPTAIDSVDPNPDVACSPSSGSFFVTGTTTVTCTATDDFGNSSTDSFDVNVHFNIGDGFKTPLNSGVLNTVKGGATVPVKFSLQAADGSYIADLSAVESFKVYSVSCPSSLVITEPVEITNTDVTSLRYDPDTNQFIQNWQTPKDPGTCKRIVLTTLDGAKASADFLLK